MTSAFSWKNSISLCPSSFHTPRPYTWTSPDRQHWNQIDYILCSQRWRSSVQLSKTRLGADWGSDHELITKFRLKLKKVGITTRPFRYDLSQIPYDYTVEVRNRFKGKAMVFPVVVYGCESWTVKKAEHQRIDAFELWCWRSWESLGLQGDPTSPFWRRSALGFLWKYNHNLI